MALSATSRARAGILLTVLCALVVVLGAPSAQASEPTHPYIVVLKEAKVANPAKLAKRHESNRGADLAQIYDTALEGYAAELTAADKRAIEQDPNVAYVERDLPVELLSQTIPTGISRVGMTANSSLNPIGNQDVQIDADVAVIDTPIDFRHPDLNVVASVNCNENDKPPYTCKKSDIISHFHGTHVAGIIGARDNGFGIVGTAPGARLWSASIGSGSGVMSGVVAALDWAVGTGKIEVVNMSLACGDSSGQPWCQSASSALKTAVGNAVDAGIVVVAAAGNEHQDVAMVPRIPASFADPITVSALGDFDGKPGALAPVPTAKACESLGATKPEEEDDSLAEFSNWGNSVDIIAPGSCILSTMPLGTGPGASDYQKLSGTSMAAPHVAGAAAVLAAIHDPSNRSDVMAIRQMLLDEGNFDWTDDSGWGSYPPDTVQEPLLDVHDSSVFRIPHPGDVGNLGAVSDETYDLDVFARSADNNLWRKSYRSADWANWGPMSLPNGEEIAGAPATISRRAGSTDVFVKGKSGGIGFRSKWQETWSSWFPIYPPENKAFLSSPAAVSRTDVYDGLSVIVRAHNGGIYLKDYFPATGWSTWHHLEAPPPGAVGSPSAAMHLNKYLHVSVRGADGAIWDKTYSHAEGWSGWVSLGGSLTSSPALASSRSGDDIYLFARGTDEAVWMRKAPKGGGWGSWQSLGGKILGDPAATSRESHGVSVFVIGLDNKIQERRYLYGGWTNWMRIDDNDCPPPECTWVPSKENAVFKSNPDPTDLVTVDETGTANVYTGYDEGYLLSDPVKSLEGELDSALLDGKGHYAIDVADVNDDLHNDLITVKDDGKVLVHLGQGDQTFAKATDTGVSVPPVMNGAGVNEPIAVADVTGDGFDDLVVFVGPGAGHLAVYAGRSDGKFETTEVKSQSGKTYSALLTRAGEYFIGVADIDGDGHADLLSQHTGTSLVVRLGKASGEFGASYSPEVFAPSLFEDGVGHEPIGMGDLNGDGRADLLVLDGETLKLHKGKADGKFESVAEPYEGKVDSSLLDGTGQELIDLLDFNGDGREDLIAAQDGDLLAYPAGGEGALGEPIAIEGEVESVREGAAGHEFVTEKPLLRRAGCDPEGCVVSSLPGVDSDVDGDRRADVITISGSSAHVFPGTDAGAGGSSTTSLSGKVNSALRDGIGHYAVDVADVDGDKRSDLITVEDDGQVLVHRGQADRTFEEAIETEVSMPPAMNGAGDIEPIAVADVTGDGRGDLVVFDGPGSGHIAVYPGEASGGFAEEAITSLSGSVNSATADRLGHYFLDVADVTGDRLADLVAIEAGASGKILTFKGKASGQFEAAVAGASLDPSLDNGSGSEPLGLADVNGDGFADVIARNEEQKPVIYKGAADGKLLYGALAHTSAVTSEVIGLLDHNRDGYADLIASDGAYHYAYKALSNGTFGSASKAASPSYSGTHELVTQRPLARRGICTNLGCSLKPPHADFPRDDLEPSVWSAAGIQVEDFEVSDLEWNWRIPSVSVTGKCLGSFTFVNAYPLYITEAAIAPNVPAGDGLFCSSALQGLEWMLSVCQHEPSGEVWVRWEPSFGYPYVAFGLYRSGEEESEEEGPEEGSSIRFGSPDKDGYIQVIGLESLGTLEMQLEVPLPGATSTYSSEVPGSCDWPELAP